MVKFKGCSILFCLLFTIYLTSESVIIAPNCNTKLILEEVKTILEDKDLKKAFCGLPHYSTEYESTVQTIWTNLQTAGDLCDLKEIPYLQSYCNISDTKYLEFSLLWFFVSPILTNKEIKMPEEDSIPNVVKVVSVFSGYTDMLKAKGDDYYNQHHFCFRFGTKSIEMDEDFEEKYFKTLEKVLESGIMGSINRNSLINDNKINDKDKSLTVLDIKPCGVNKESKTVLNNGDESNPAGSLNITGFLSNVAQKKKVVHDISSNIVNAWHLFYYELLATINDTTYWKVLDQIKTQGEQIKNLTEEIKNLKTYFNLQHKDNEKDGERVKRSKVQSTKISHDEQ